MSTTITAAELARNLVEVLDRVRNRGERFTVERDGEPIASLGPTGEMAVHSWEEFFARVGDLGPVGGGFADDLEQIQREQPIVEAATLAQLIDTSVIEFRRVPGLDVRQPRW